MDSDNKEKIFYDDDGEYRNLCHDCDNIATDRFYDNHLKPQTSLNLFRRRQHLYSTNISTSQ